MEISNEIKARVFAQYLGQQFKNHNGVQGMITCFALSQMLRGEIGMLAILRPLSDITDEDAIEVARIAVMPANPESGWRIVKALFVMDYTGWIDNVSHHHIPSICQYLIEQGYDLPQRLLGNKTLKEAGLCVYQNQKV